MREKPRDKERLIHINQAIENIESFIKNKTYEEFYQDPILYHAVVNNLAILGEAAYKLTKDFLDNHPEVPWKDIIHMRHFLIHGYYQVAKNIIWDTIKEDLQPLKNNINKFLKEE